jgi:hypothetical protein
MRAVSGAISWRVVCGKDMRVTPEEISGKKLCREEFTGLAQEFANRIILRAICEAAQPSFSFACAADEFREKEGCAASQIARRDAGAPRRRAVCT